MLRKVSSPVVLFNCEDSVIVAAAVTVNSLCSVEARPDDKKGVSFVIKISKLLVMFPVGGCTS